MEPYRKYEPKLSCWFLRDSVLVVVRLISRQLQRLLPAR